MPPSPPRTRHSLVTRKWGCVGTGCDTISRVSALPFIRLGGLPFPFSAGSVGGKLDTPGSFPQFFVPRGLYGIRLQVEILGRWRRRDPFRPCGLNYSEPLEGEVTEKASRWCLYLSPCLSAELVVSSSAGVISKLFFVVMTIASFTFTKHYLVKQLTGPSQPEGTPSVPASGPVLTDHFENQTRRSLPRHAGRAMSPQTTAHQRLLFRVYFIC